MSEVSTARVVNHDATVALGGGARPETAHRGAPPPGVGLLATGRPVGPYQRIVKPIIDIVGTAVLLVLLLPVVLAVALAVRAKLGKHVIYRQERMGRYGKPFVMYKFRTMHPDRRRAQVPFEGIDRRVCHKRDDDPRHTPFGRSLRRSSLDELPQLWNVMKGNMSLVGPSPSCPTWSPGTSPGSTSAIR